MLRTPVKVLMTDGTKAATQITMILAASPSPSQTMASGIQASGGIGRISRKTGLMRASARRLPAHRQPEGHARRRGNEETQEHEPRAVHDVRRQPAVRVAEAGAELLRGEPDFARARKAPAADDAGDRRQQIPEREENEQRDGCRPGAAGGRGASHGRPFGSATPRRFRSAERVGNCRREGIAPGEETTPRYVGAMKVLRVESLQRAGLLARCQFSRSTRAGAETSGR